MSFFKEFKNMKDAIIDYLLILPTISLYLLVSEKVIVGNRSEGKSMEPTLQDSSMIIVDKFFYKFRGIRRGDVIIAQSMVNPAMDICKRVALMEGELIHETNFKIPKNHIWIEGDNKHNSFDSRHHGPIPLCLVKGRVLFSLYPFKFL